MHRVAVIVGTVPEAVKLGPVCRELGRHRSIVQTYVLLSGQHRERVEEILELFGVSAVDLLPGRLARTSLSSMASGILRRVAQWLAQLRPDLVVVQGDTTTALMGALAAFYEQIPVAHVEAGLTTGNVLHPYPEELHREVIGKLAAIHFAPSRRAAEHARQIARPGASVYQTGNTCVDALVHCRRMGLLPAPSWGGRGERKQILVTVHRRENFDPVRAEAIGEALARLATERRDAEVSHVGHTHPAMGPLVGRLCRSRRVVLYAPKGYVDWLRMLSGCYLVVSDSGGAQEEGPWLRKPVLVLRDETERPEVVEAGAAKLVGADPEAIYRACVRLLDDPRAYRRMQLSRSRYPYGRGNAAQRIVRRVLRWLGEGRPSGEVNGEYLLARGRI